MTTGWLLLLVIVVSSQSADSQLTTDDEICTDAGLLYEMQKDIESLFQQHQRILDNQQRILQILEPEQTTKPTPGQQTTTSKQQLTTTEPSDSGKLEKYQQ